MTLLKHELRRGRTALIGWTLGVAAMLLLCILLFGEVAREMESFGALFASLGAFATALGMDKLNIGTISGYYGIECGAVLGLAGGIYAATMGGTALSKEEGGRTAEFLLTHPISRVRVVMEKLAACAVQILIFNVVVCGLSALSLRLMSTGMNWQGYFRLHGAMTVMHLQMMVMCLGISAFLRRGGMGIGIGLTLVLYFFNLFSNMSSSMVALTYMTPFAYADASRVMFNAPDVRLMLYGLLTAAVIFLLGLVHYRLKDIMA